MTRLALLLLLVSTNAARGGEAVVVVLPAKATAGTPVVTLGQVAKLHGGDDKLRAKLAAVDLVERTKKDAAVTISRRQIEIRLQLAGYTATDVLVGGADAVTVAVAKKTVPADDVIATAKKAMLAQFPDNGDGLAVSLAQPLAVKLPEVVADDTIAITAVPHAATTKVGRVQMDVTIKVNGETKLAHPVHFDVKATKVEPVLVKVRQPVRLVVRLGGMNVEATGEAMQDGRAGETIKVQNAASKKVVTGRVTAAGVVDVDLGGPP